MKSPPAHSIISALNEPRRQLLRRRILAVCFQTFACLSIAVLVLQGISWLIPIREHAAAALVVLFLLTGGGGVLLVWLRVLVRPSSMTHIARLVEKGHPEFHDALICAVQLTEKSPGNLNPVENALLEEVKGKLAGLNLGIAFLAPAYTFRRLVAKGAIAVLLGVLAVRSPVFKKAVYACGKGSERGIVVTPGDVELAKGVDLVVNAGIHRWREAASIDVSGEKGKKRYDMHHRGNAFTFTFYEVDLPFRYRVVTPDLSSPWYVADVYSPPGIAQVRCDVIAPEYTGNPPVVYEDLVDCSMLEGSKVKVSVFPTVPGDVWLEKDGELSSVGSATEDAAGSVPRVTTTFTVSRETSVRLFVQDAAGRKSPGKTAKFSVYADTPPVVEMLSPEREKILRPDELLFIEARAMDDFGLQEATLHVSVAGRRSLTFNLHDGGGEVDLRLQRQLTTEALEAESGDVLALFVTAKDNKRPEGQIGRSEIRFVEIRADIKPRDANDGQKLPTVDVQRIIAELRRLITLTYGIMTPSGPRGSEDEIKLVTGLGDLRTLITRQMEEFRKQVSASEAGAMEAWYTQGGAYVEEARRLARVPDFSLSVTSQEKALSLFTKLAQELMKNKSSKPREKPGEGQGDGQSAQKKDSNKRAMSLAEAMEILRKARVELSRLADGQAAQNQRLSRMRQFGEREIDELTASQKELADDIGGLKEQLEKVALFNDLTKQVGKAGDAMSETADTLNGNNLEAAIREGQRARMELLAAIRQTESGLRQLAARQLSYLAAQLNALANLEDKLAEFSREAGDKESVDKRTRDALRNAQKKIVYKAENVIQAAQELSGEMVSSFPEAGKDLRVALAGKHASELTKTGRQAETALLYKKFGKAAGHQKNMAVDMRSLSQEIAFTADKLPATSPAELIRLLNQLGETRALVKSGAEKGRIQRQVNQAAETLAEMGRRMNDVGLMEVSGQLGEAVDRESGGGNFSETEGLLKAAGQLVKRHLTRSRVEEKETLMRKLARPPEKYRRQVEEYFKELSGD